MVNEPTRARPAPPRRPSPIYDVIVAGLGGHGSAALWQAARRGRRALGLERFDIGHAMGSSHGINRIIRLAYFESPRYVPLLRRAYELWREAEGLFGEQLLFITGSIDGGRADGRVVRGALEACAEHGLEHELLDAAEVNRRFPGYRLPEGFAAVLQPEGGFVASERAIHAHLSMAMGLGAEVRAREPMLSWEATPGGGVRVTTPAGTYEAGSLVLSTGAWIGEHAPALAGLAVPERQVLGWFAPRDPAAYAMGRYPVCNLLGDTGHYYAFPQWGAPGFKLGLYHHLNETGPADALDRTPNAADEAALRRGIQELFPLADGPALRLQACLFTNTPDEHFVVDRLPGLPQVVVASPCSGHGYKFASAMGEVLADLALSGGTRHDLSLFALDRFAAAA